MLLLRFHLFTAARVPTATSKSKLGPSFFTPAGATLFVVRPSGRLKPELVSGADPVAEAPLARTKTLRTFSAVRSVNRRVSLRPQLPIQRPQLDGLRHVLLSDPLGPAQVRDRHRHL